MSSTYRNASSPDFFGSVVRALEAGPFSPPSKREAQILLCNSAAWTLFVESAQCLLSPDERTKSARLRFDRDRSTYIVAHALWRVILGICLEVDATDVRLTSTAAGQPRLPGTALSTSLSHSGDWVAIAVCGDATVGVDVEHSPPHAALNGLMRTICTPAEIAELEPLSPPEREVALLKLWTRKEALLKAFGVGLGADPSLLSSTANKLVAPPPSPAAPDQIPCRAFNLELPDGVVGALAVPASITTVRLCVLGGY
jgi:4'-phosphopantetheinyl transferase